MALEKYNMQNVLPGACLIDGIQISISINCDQFHTGYSITRGRQAGTCRPQCI